MAVPKFASFTPQEAKEAAIREMESCVGYLTAGERELAIKRGMAMYRAVDCLEWFEVMYKGESLAEARAACVQRTKDTDGECFVFVEERVLGDDGVSSWAVVG